jgi:hypothetical protein
LTQVRPGQQEVLPPQEVLLQHLPFVQTSPQHSELVVHVPPDDTHGPLQMLPRRQMPLQHLMLASQKSPGFPQQRPLTQLPLQQSSSPAEQKLPSVRHAPQVARPSNIPNVLQILLQH